MQKIISQIEKLFWSILIISGCSTVCVSQSVCDCLPYYNQIPLDTLSISKDSSFSEACAPLDSAKIYRLFKNNIAGKHLSYPSLFHRHPILQSATIGIETILVSGTTLPSPAGIYSRLNVTTALNIFGKMPLELKVSLLYSNNAFGRVFRPIVNSGLDRQRLAEVVDNERYSNWGQSQLDGLLTTLEQQQLLDLDAWEREVELKTNLSQLEVLESNGRDLKYLYLRTKSDSLLQQLKLVCEKIKPLDDMRIKYDSLKSSNLTSLTKLDKVSSSFDSLRNLTARNVEIENALGSKSSFSSKILENVSNLKLGLHSVSNNTLVSGSSPINGVTLNLKQKNTITIASVGLQQNWRNMMFDFDELTNSFGKSQLLGYLQFEQRYEGGSTALEFMTSGNANQLAEKQLSGQNQVIGIKSKYSLFKGLDFDGSYAYTLTRLEGMGVDGAKLSSNEKPDAVQLGLNGKVTKNIGVKISYRQVSPLFFSQANPFLVPNQRRISIQTQSNFFKKRLQLSGGWLPTRPVSNNDQDIRLAPTVKFTQWNIQVVVIPNSKQVFTASYLPVSYVLKTRTVTQAQEFGLATVSHQTKMSLFSKPFESNISCTNMRTALFIEDTTLVRQGLFVNLNFGYQFNSSYKIVFRGMSDIPSIYSQKYRRDRYVQTSITGQKKKWTCELGADMLNIPEETSMYLGGIVGFSIPFFTHQAVSLKGRYRINEFKKQQYMVTLQWSCPLHFSNVQPSIKAKN